MTKCDKFCFNINIELSLTIILKQKLQNVKASLEQPEYGSRGRTFQFLFPISSLLKKIQLTTQNGFMNKKLQLINWVINWDFKYAKVRGRNNKQEFEYPSAASVASGPDAEI